MNKTTIFVNSIINSRLATKGEQADLVISEIKNQLKNNELVKVSFVGIDVMISNFASPFIWQLYIKKVEVDKISLIGLSPSQKSLLTTVKETVELKLGKNPELSFPDNKVDLVNFLNKTGYTSLKIFTNKEVEEVYNYLKRKIRKKVTVSKMALEDPIHILAKDKENKNLLDYGYLSCRVIDEFLMIEPFYMESDRLKENSKTWEEIKENSRNNIIDYFNIDDVLFTKEELELPYEDK